MKMIRFRPDRRIAYNPMLSAASSDVPKNLPRSSRLMRRTVRLIALLGSGTILLSFTLLVVNQTAQVVQLASVVHPTLGTVTLGVLVTTYAGLIGVPIV